MNSKRFVKLDGLRGIFSLMVVFFHYSDEFLPRPLYDFFLFRQSYLFVDYFFVLSGFVIAMNYEDLKGVRGVVFFLKKRFIRLYPLLFFTVNVYLCYHLFSNYLLKDLMPTLFETQGYLLFDFSKYFDTLFFTNSTNLLGNTYGINYPSWSISAEMIAYMFFGIISIFSVGRWKLGVLFTTILVSAYFGFQVNYFNGSGSFGFIRALLGFNLGVLSWTVFKKGFNFPKNIDLLLPIVILLCFYGLSVIDAESILQDVIRIVFVPCLFSMSIIVLINTNGHLGKFLSTKPILFLGTISYSVYLNHAFIIEKIPETFFKLFKFESSSFSQIAALLISIFVVILISTFTYAFVEKRIGMFLRTKILA